MSRPTESRQASIDVLRAVAIGLMVVVHFVENLSGWYDGGSGPFEGVHRVWWLPTGFAAPMFTVLSGMSYRLWLAVQTRRGESDETISKRTVRRGLFLIGLGFVFNVLVWLPEDVFNWDILTLIGLGLLVLDVARRMPDWVVVLAAASLLAVSPTMRVVADYSAFWQAGYFDYEFTLADVLLGWLVVGYFPVFPWLAFPLLGHALAAWLFNDQGEQRSRRVAASGIVGIAIALVLIVSWPTLPAGITGGMVSAWTMFPASTAYCLGTLGTVTLAAAALHWVVDRGGQQWGWLLTWATPLSRHALSMYLLHHVVHVWPLWAWGAATGGATTALWQVAMPPAASLALAAGFLVTAAWLLRWIDQRRAPSAESLMRWVCD